MNLSKWLLVLLACCGCGTSPETAYYALASARGTVRQASLGTIEVRRPSIPGYLDRSAILARWDGHRMQLSPNAAWGEPISAMIGRVLAEDLGERLRGTIVFSAAPSVSIQASAVVELAIWKFDLDREGSLQLNGLVSVRSADGLVPQSTRAFALQARAPTSETGAVVGTMSSLLGQLADEIASTLVARATEGPQAP